MNMIRPKITPGPWLIETAKPAVWIEDHERQEYVAVAFKRGDGATDSNGQAIAALPDMMEALEVMLKTFNSKEIDPLTAFAAIEKSKGALIKAGYQFEE